MDCRSLGHRVGFIAHLALCYRQPRYCNVSRTSAVVCSPLFNLKTLSRPFSFTLIVGMGSGGFFSLQGSIVAQLVGSHRIDKAIGAIELVESVGFFAGPVTAGLLLDAFGGPEAGPAAYRPAMVSY